MQEFSGSYMVNQTKLAIGAAGIFLLLAAISYPLWDIPLAHYCRALNPGIIKIADFITSFGVATWYIAGSLGIYAFFRFARRNILNASRALFVFLSLSATGIFITALKWVAGRHRPSEYFIHDLFGFNYFGVGYELTSFPSGHAQTVFTLATALTILFPRWGLPLFVMAILVAASRVMLTSHYLSDVFAGAAVGIIFTMVIKIIFDRKNIKLIPEK